MVEVVVQVIAGLVVAACSGVSGYILRRNRPTPSRLIPSVDVPIGVSYSYLDGAWHFHYVSRHPSVNENQLWLHAHASLKVRGAEIEGLLEMPFDEHPSNNLKYRFYGEIREGRISLRATSLLDPADFFVIIFPNVVKTELVGLWMGFDGENHLFAGPCTLLREEGEIRELTSLIRASSVSVAQEPLASLGYRRGGSAKMGPLRE